MDTEDHNSQEERLRGVLEEILGASSSEDVERIEKLRLTGPRAIEENDLGHVVDDAIMRGAEEGLPIERICRYASDAWIDMDDDDDLVCKLVQMLAPDHAFMCLTKIFQGLAERFVVFAEDVSREVEALWSTKISHLQSWLLDPRMRDFAILVVHKFPDLASDVTEFSLRLKFMRWKQSGREWPPRHILDQLPACDLSSPRKIDSIFRSSVGHGDLRAVDWENKTIDGLFKGVESTEVPPILEFARAIMRLEFA
jgi:hypothetical protein